MNLTKSGSNIHADNYYFLVTIHFILYQLLLKRMMMYST